MNTKKVEKSMYCEVCILASDCDKPKTCSCDKWKTTVSIRKRWVQEHIYYLIEILSNVCANINAKITKCKHTTAHWRVLSQCLWCNADK